MIACDTRVIEANHQGVVGVRVLVVDDANGHVRRLIDGQIGRIAAPFPLGLEGTT